MRFVTATLFILIASLTAIAQESTLVVTDTMYSSNAFSSEDVLFPISKKEGWVFKAGNVPNAANPDLDTKSWKKFKPSDLSADNLDENGRFEGWFRLKIKIQNRQNYMPPGVWSLTWGASEVFANGKKIAEFGKLGTNRASFVENKFNGAFPLPTNLQADSTYLMAIHVIEFADPFSLYPSLKSANNNKGILVFTNQDTVNAAANFWPKHTFYNGLLSAIATTLALLFWILYGLNRNETNIRRFAIGCTFLAILSITISVTSGGDLGYVAYALTSKASLIAAVSYLSYIPIILAGVFNRTISKKSSILLSITFLIVLGGAIFQSSYAMMLIAIPLILSFYFLISSWKGLKGAQWAIVSGFLLSFVFLIVYVVDNSNFRSDFVLVEILIYSVGPPLGMLIYVSTRFGEMIEEVRVNAAQVLRLSDEKREQALNQQKVLEEEVEKQTADLKQTLSNLKSTQTQLIQAEKMASLGELTAGIAHEIQNPLNFVNNFSDVSMELLAEMNAEIDTGDMEEVKAISSDIRQNLQKISNHGRRAESIVKGMLQHSRASSGEKEPTNINALADEYLRLAYHGLRAKDKSFNADLVTNFDQNLPKVNVIPQDLGRVLLNLFTNAFYATHQKQKSSDQSFKPVVEVSTEVADSQILIRVKDNGIGIPEAIKDKILQPFFTTKPTGEGTGLGLSLSYDIVVKGHAGELFIESEQGVGSEFRIQLPMTLT